MKSKLYIRADGGTQIGLGHIVRCLALADMLRDIFDVYFLVQKTSDRVYEMIRSEGHQWHIIPDYSSDVQHAAFLQEIILHPSIMLLDGYHFRDTLQKQILLNGHLIAAIDDLHAWHQYADAVINHAGSIKSSDYQSSPTTQFYLGYHYVLLRKEFLRPVTERLFGNKPKRFFISMGAADMPGNTLKFAQSILEWRAQSQVHLMVSDINPHKESIQEWSTAFPHQVHLHFDIQASELRELLESTDLVICPASVISLEAAASGTPVLAGITAPNQIDNLKGLLDHQIAFDGGKFNEMSNQDIIQKLSEICSDDLNECSARQRTIFDGKSPERLRAVFEKLQHRILKARNATHADLQLYFEWANDPEVRSNSFNTSPITIEQHTAWFEKAISSSDFQMILLEHAEIPIGQVRFQITGSHALLNYSIAAAHRGLGWGSYIVRSAMMFLKSQRPEIQTIEALVKPTNHASLRVFQKLEYLEEGSNDVSLRYIYHW